LSRAPGAARRLAAGAVTMGVLAAMGAPGGARAETPPAAGGACAHDAALEALVARTLRKKVLDIQPNPGVRIEIAFGCPAVARPHQATALAAHGHGGFVSVIDLDLDPGAGGAAAVRALRLRPIAAPALGGPPPSVTRVVLRPEGEAVRQALAFASTALAATIRVELPPPKPGGVQTVAARGTSHDEALEIRLAGPAGQSSSRRWSGYVASTHADARVPLEAAWEALWALADGRLRPEPADAADRAIFQRLFDDDGSRPGFLQDGLLAAGAVLATPALVPSLTTFLQAASKKTVTLAVNALATATGTDLRRDAAGAIRPLADVTAAYRALAAPPPAPHH